MHGHLVPHIGQAMAKGVDGTGRIGAEILCGDKNHA